MTQTDKPYVGQQVTVTDARGVKGPGVVTEVRESGAYNVRVDFSYSYGSMKEPENNTFEWFFYKGSRSGYGLTIDFKPYIPDATDAPVDVTKLRKGDEVWIKARFDCRRGDGRLQLKSFDQTGLVGANPADIIRHIPAAKPLAVGDRVRTDGSFTVQNVSTGVGFRVRDYTIVAFLSDGRAVLEYDVGETTNVIARDVACLERV